MNSEQDIIIRLRNGHSKALAEVMSIYKDYVFTILRAMLTQFEAEEACQDTFIKVYKRINSYNNESKFSTWLYTIAYRTGLDYIKKRKTLVQFEETIIPDSKKADDGLLTSDLNQWIQNELLKLKAEDATILKLYYLNEYNIEEISQITGMSASNVKVRLHRIRISLKEKFRHYKLSDFIN